MELEITTSVWIDIDYFIKRWDIDINTPIDRIAHWVDIYVNEMDDCDYCLIEAKEKKKIIEAICNKVGVQMSLFN